ncbi:MAG: tyrosine--tRNA ligase, partial [Bacteroidetes bacterium]|nr:tyrosine--tRNA ligase [Bacteroidota bacterium]
NEKCIGIQLRKLLDFDCGRKSAEMVNNFDWFINISTLAFLRDVGKHITINYLLAKGFIKERLEKELSFTEFNYILMQAYDFLYLWQNKNCKLQMGGSDQWGNITTGIELIRKKCGGDAFGITSPLLLKPDGTKFGKTESGNIWLDPAKTSPYKFFQFWLNISDEEAGRCIRIFTFLPKDQIASLEKEHSIAPEGRILQKTIAKILTAQVHSEEACRKATGAGEILFGSGHVEALKNYSSVEIDEIFEGVPRFSLSKTAIESGMGIIDFTCVHTSVFPSKSEARRMIGNGGLSINKTKVVDETLRISTNHLIAGRYILVQKGKKNFFLISAE